MIISTTNPDVIQIITLIVSVFAPIAVGLVTKISTASSVKAVLLALIAAVMGVLNGFLDSPSGFDLYPALISAVEVFTISVATYVGLWRPTGVSNQAQRMMIKD